MRTELEARAARHAALSDPARLRIIDLLTLSDLAPGKLQDHLGMPSNLVAHHLRVLEREGMIVRSRSEADRRRTYVRLVQGGFDQLGPSAVAATKRVLFVCTANSARSQLAAELWSRRSVIPVASAGTHPAPAIASGAIATARRHGLEMSARDPEAFDSVAVDTDLIITVCDAAQEELRLDTLHWSVRDPVTVGTAAAFDAAFEELTQRIDDFAGRVILA